MALLGGATIVTYLVRLTEPLALSPWEPAIAMEAVRLNAGLPLYESAHATHMYGPLLTVMLAGIFRFTGLNLLAARAVFSVFALAVPVLLGALLCRGKLRVHLPFAILLFLGINLRSNFIALSAQPDFMAGLFGISGLALWIGRGRSRARLLISLGLFLAGMLTKQTSAAFALAPIVHGVLWGRKWRLKNLALSALPAGFLFAALVLIRLAWPALYHGMVTNAGALRVNYDRIPTMAVYLVATFPLIFIAMATMLRSRTCIPGKERWIVSAIFVLAPLGVLTTVKSGGGLNSLLFAYLAMTALVVSQLGEIFRWMSVGGGRKRFCAASMVALAVVCSFFFNYVNGISVLFMKSGDDKYAQAVAFARRLGPGLITPQDPTIAYSANGHFGCDFFFELDGRSVNGQWATLPMPDMQRELERASSVIEVKSYVPTPQFISALDAAGYRRVDAPELADSAYGLWVKAGP